MAGTTVTGDWAGQNINLRNAATESTMASVLQSIEGLRKIASQIEANTKESTKGGKKGTVANAADETAAALAKAASKGNTLGEAFQKAEGETSIFGKAMKVAGGAAGAFSAILYKVSGSIRGMDSGIDNLGSGIRGITDSFGGLGDMVQASLEQVQKSYGAFSQLAQSGYAGAIDIDNLSKTAIELGMSLPQYTNMMSSMAGTFAAGGNNMTAMSNKFKDSLKQLTSNATGTSDKLARMGIPLQQQSDFASRLVQAQGSYARVLEISGGNFDSWLMQSTEKLLKMSRVTGLTTDALLAQQQALQKDPKTFFNENLLRSFYGSQFESIKENMTAIYGGDANAAQQAMMDRVVGRMDRLSQALTIVPDKFGLDRGAISTMANPRATADQIDAAIKILKPQIDRMMKTTPDGAVVLAQLAEVSPEFGKLIGTVQKMGAATDENATATGSQADAQIEMSKKMRELALQTADVNKNMIKAGINLSSLAISAALAGKELQRIAVEEISKLLQSDGINGVSVETIRAGMEGALNDFSRTHSGSLTGAAGGSTTAEAPGSSTATATAGNGRSGFSTASTPLVSKNPMLAGLSTEEAAMLNMIAGRESGGDYNIINYKAKALMDKGRLKTSGGPGQHPFANGYLVDGHTVPGNEMYTASGRYQMVYSTWLKAAKMAGVNPNDFSPANQDAAALALAKSIYRQNTGKDLSSDLKNPAAISDIINKGLTPWSVTAGGPGFSTNDFTNSLKNTSRLSGTTATANSSTTTSAAQIRSNAPLSPLAGGTGSSIAEEDKVKAAAAAKSADGSTGSSTSSSTAAAAPGGQDPTQSVLEAIAKNTSETVTKLAALLTKNGIPNNASIVTSYGNRTP
jgi:muramidase (phage lysozyme)